MFGIPYVRQDWIDAEIAQAAARDPFGHRLHVLFGLLWVFLAPGPMSVVEVAVFGLIGISVFRAYYVHRTWRSFGCHPMLWMMAAWASWQMLTISWSPDPMAGWMEAERHRWVAAMWLLWPVMQHRQAFITALVLGFLAGNVAQVLHSAAVAFDISWLKLDQNPDRNPGWWQPVVAGSMLTAGLGLHLPAAVMGTGRTRWAAVVLAVVTFAGVIVTGSRGAWLASAALVLIAMAVGLVRWIRARRDAEAPVNLLRRVIVTVIVLVAAGTLLWLTAGKAIARRYENAREEIRGVLDRHDYTTWTGARVLMAKAAVAEIEAHPLKGVGAGGYQKWAEEHRDPAEKGYIHVHAHNAYLHIAATTGLVGLALYLAVMGMGLYGAFKGLGARMGTYAAGPGFALIGLLLVGMTDVIQLNAQTAALSCVLLGLCYRPRPKEAGWLRWDKAAWGRPFPK